MNLTSTPRASRENITVQHIGNETLLYDELRHKAFCLNQISGLVWTLSDGNHTPTQIAAAATCELQHPVSEEIVRFALNDLQLDGLLQPEAVPVVMNAISRREMVKKLGIGAVMLMPVITAVLAPTPAFAASCPDDGGGDRGGDEGGDGDGDGGDRGRGHDGGDD